jgi:hypothetical protein
MPAFFIPAETDGPATTTKLTVESGTRLNS